MTAGDAARIPSGWVPTESPPDPADAPLPQEPETQPLTRASIRAAEAKRLAEEAEERRRASLAEEAAVPVGWVLAAVTAVALAVLMGPPPWSDRARRPSRLGSRPWCSPGGGCG